MRNSITYNERSWAIDIITEITLYSSRKNQIIKKAGGENTINTGKKKFFPDVLLYGENSDILMGWELKMPDTLISDFDFINNATKKAKILNLNSFLLWNGKIAALYKQEGSDFKLFKSWDTSHNGVINNRKDIASHRELWVCSLHNILKNLNMFLESGDIKRKPLIDSFKDNSIIDFIFKSSKLNALALEKASREDNIFGAESNIWWQLSQYDYPQSNKWEVLSEIILVNWINKFLFAHILTADRDEAKDVYNITYDTTPSQAQEIFKNISSTCDFWNIFQPQLGLEYIHSYSWCDLIELNNFLKDIELKSINQKLLQGLLESIIFSSKRKIAGQYTTPIFLARLLVLLTMNNKTEKIHDPCCGTGTIIRAAYDIKREAGISVEESLSSIFASDKVSYPLQIAMMSISNPENFGQILQVFKQDCTELMIGNTLEFRDPFNGSIVNEIYKPIKNITSNLPFIKQEDLKILNPRIGLKTNKFINQQLNKKDKINSKSDLYAYLPFTFWNILDDNGNLGIIISNSWLGTEWGAKFKELLAKFYKIKYIVTTSKGRWFKNTDVITNIIILSKRKIIKDPSDIEKTKFITIFHDFDNDSTNKKVREIHDSIVTNTPSSDFKLEEYSTKEILTLPLNWNALFSNISWLEEVNKKIIFCNTLFEINRGERRGWNPMFYPEKNHCIEPMFIKYVLRTSRDIKTLIATAETEAFCCSLSEEELLNHKFNGAIDWINTFKHGFNNKGEPLPNVLEKQAAKDEYWYSMSDSRMADLVASVNFDKRIFIAKLNTRSFVDQRLTRFTVLDSNTDIELAHALLNSVLGIFFIESLGFGRGQGALDLSSTRMKKYLKMLDPSQLSKEQIINIKAKFNLFKNRNINVITEELNNPIRKEFDLIVLKSYGIEHLYIPIKESFLFLYNMRVNR